MKEFITKAELARLANVSPPAITKAVEWGRVIVGKKGIDLSDPTNMLFIEKHKAERARTSGKESPRKAHGPRGSQARSPSL